MNHLNLYYLYLQHHKFLHNIYEHVLFLKFLHYHKKLIYFAVFDIQLIFQVFFIFLERMVVLLTIVYQLNFQIFQKKIGNSDKSFNITKFFVLFLKTFGFFTMKKKNFQQIHFFIFWGHFFLYCTQKLFKVFWDYFMIIDNYL